MVYVKCYSTLDVLVEGSSLIRFGLLSVYRAATAPPAPPGRRSRPVQKGANMVGGEAGDAGVGIVGDWDLGLEGWVIIYVPIGVCCAKVITANTGGVTVYSVAQSETAIGLLKQRLHLPMLCNKTN